MQSIVCFVVLFAAAQAAPGGIWGGGDFGGFSGHQLIQAEPSYVKTIQAPVLQQQYVAAPVAVKSVAPAASSYATVTQVHVQHPQAHVVKVAQPAYQIPQQVIKVAQPTIQIAQPTYAKTLAIPQASYAVHQPQILAAPAISLGHGYGGLGGGWNGGLGGGWNGGWNGGKIW